MHSNEMNKVFAAILAMLTFTVALQIFAEQIFKPKKPERPAFSVEVAGAPAAAPAAAAPTPVNMAQVMSAADAARGQAAFRAACASCHNADQGGRNGTGPNLWNTVAQKMAHADGFNYSRALRERSTANGQWGYEELYRFLENPRAFLPGTSMSFAGVRRQGERADIIAYLRQQANPQPPLPQ